MKEIPLSQGKMALVDDEDYELISQFNWYASKDRNTYYAVGSRPQVNGVREFIIMHRLILDAPPHLQTDHINGNGLDNRRCNIRLTTVRGNGQNLHISKTSKYPGVRIDKLGKKWQAQIKINGKQRHLGTYEREIDAATVYKVACAVLVGEQP